MEITNYTLTVLGQDYFVHSAFDITRPTAEQYAIRVYAIIDGEHQPVELLSSFSPNTDNSPAFSELLFTSGVNDIRLAGIIAASGAYAEATFEQNELVYA